MSSPSNPALISLEVILCPATLGGFSAGGALRRADSSPKRRSSSAANWADAGRLRLAGRYGACLAAAAAWRTFTVPSFLIGTVFPAAGAGPATGGAGGGGPGG